MRHTVPSHEPSKNLFQIDVFHKILSWLSFSFLIRVKWIDMAFHMLTVTPLLMRANLELSHPGDRETLGWPLSSSFPGCPG